MFKDWLFLLYLCWFLFSDLSRATTTHGVDLHGQGSDYAYPPPPAHANARRSPRGHNEADFKYVDDVGMGGQLDAPANPVIAAAMATSLYGSGKPTCQSRFECPLHSNPFVFWTCFLSIIGDARIKSKSLLQINRNMGFYWNRSITEF